MNDDVTESDFQALNALWILSFISHSEYINSLTQDLSYASFNALPQWKFIILIQDRALLRMLADIVGLHDYFSLFHFTF